MAITKDREVPGLYVRHGSRGDTWNYARNIQGKMIRHALGPLALHTVADARRWATNINLEGAGKSPHFTIQEVAARHAESAKQQGNREPEYVKYNTQLHCPDWLPRSLSEITRVMINDRHSKIFKKSGPAAAHRWVIVMRVVFNYAKYSLGWKGENEAKGVKTAQMKPRRVVFEPEQITAFMTAAQAEGEYWHSLFTVIVETGMRRTNCCQMEWSEVRGDTWTIPASKFKNKEPHSVYLRPAVQAALALRRAATSGRHVFPSPMFDDDRPLGEEFYFFRRLQPRPASPRPRRASVAGTGTLSTSISLWMT